MSTVLHIDDNTFESEVIKSDKPVLVDFSAEWCGPCQRMGPILEQFANINSDRVKVCKIDIDESPVTGAKFGIRSIPTIMLFVDEKPVQTKVGMHTVDMLETILTTSLNK